MKKIITLAGILVFSIGTLIAQPTTNGSNDSTYNTNSTLDSLFQQHDRFNFASPANPAFLLLDQSPSQILRPSSPKELAIYIGELTNGSNASLPQDVGLEFSPAMLIKQQLDKPANWAKAWTPLRVDLGISRADSGGGINEFVGDFALGLHYTLIDSCHERHFEAKYKEEMDSLLKPYIPRLENAFIDSVYNLDTTKSKLEIQSGMATQLQAYVQKGLEKQSIRMYKANIAGAKKEWKKARWASQILDIAAAVSFHSSAPRVISIVPDSLARRDSTPFTFPSLTVFRNFQGFVSYSMPLNARGKVQDTLVGNKTQWGALVLGLSTGGTLLDDTTRQITGTDTTHEYASSLYANVCLNGRCYVGTNRLKGFLEAQANWDNRNPNQIYYMADMGLEIGIVDGIWLELYGGVTNQGTEQYLHPDLEPVGFSQTFSGTGKPRFVANFDLKFSIPEFFGNQ